MLRLPLLFSFFAFISLAQTRFQIQTIAGSDPSSHTISIEDPRGSAADAAGNLYVSDAAKHQVIRISPSGQFTVIAGVGKPGFSGDGGPAKDAQLNQPYGLAIDPTGNLYIADLQNARVRKVDTNGRISTVAGGGTSPPTLSIQDATAVALKAPRNVAADLRGNLYISDFGDHRVLRLGPGGKLFVFAGTGSPGSAASVAVATAGALSFPAGVFVTAADTVFIADSGNHAIRRVDSGIMTRVTVPEAIALINLPVGLCADPAQNVFVASNGFDQVVRLSAEGAVSVIARDVRDVACDTSGNIYIVSVNGARKITPAGNTILLTGASLRFRGEGTLATEALLNQPADIKTGPGGTLYIADTGNNRVRKVDGGIITTAAGDGVAGFGGEGEAAALAHLFRPQAIAVDSAGNLYIADTQNHRVRRVGANGKITTIAGTGLPGFNGDSRPGIETQLHTPCGLAVDASGVVYIADTGNHRIRRVTAGGSLLTVAGTGTRGFGGDGAAASAALIDTPLGMAFDAAGNLYFADNANRRVRKISPSGIITTAAANAGQPAGVAIDAQGVVHISDLATHSVLAIDSAGVLRAIAGSGERGFSGDGAAATEAKLDSPAGLATDASGNVYVADSGNHRIRKLMPAVIEPPTLLPPPVEQNDIRVLHSATLEATSIAPGMLVTLQGSGIGPATPMSGTMGANGSLSTELGTVQVRFDGRPAPILYAQSNLVNVQVPYAIAGQSTTKIEVFRGTESRGVASAMVKAFVPGIFTAGSGAGPANALNEDFSVNQSATPAAKGSLVTFYATGEGSPETAGAEGRLNEPPYPVPAAPVSVTIDGRAAEIAALAVAATSPGVLQITVRVPAPTNSGPVPLAITVGGVASQSGVTIFVR